MGEDEYDEPTEVEKSINAWRQSERKVMVGTIQDLIRRSHKYAKSQYTPSAQRARWTLLAGKLIWYKDQILKNFSLEAMTIEMQELKKRVIEGNERRERERRTRGYPFIGFRNREDRKKEQDEEAEDGEAKAADADELEGGKEAVSEVAE